MPNCHEHLMTLRPGARHPVKMLNASAKAVYCQLTVIVCSANFSRDCPDDTGDFKAG